MVLHALFGNEQDSCCSHQAAADHIEDGGADAAGAGQGSAGVVHNCDTAVAPRPYNALSFRLKGDASQRRAGFPL